MKPQYQVTGNFKDGKNTAQFENLPIFVINDNDVIIYYCPVFDLSGYGKDDAEAEKSLNVAIDEFFKYTMNKKTLDLELSRLGWTKQKRKKRFIPPVMSDMVKNHEFLSEIINEHDFRKETMPVAIPA